MKKATMRYLAGFVIVATLTAWPGGAAASTAASGSPARCGKGYAADTSDEPRAHSWHALALTSMLDVILPPLAEQVASAGEPNKGASRGLAKAERGILAGVLSAAVSAGLAAIGSSLDPPSEAESHASSDVAPAHPAAAGSSPSSCTEGDGTI
jgi:hypothetical protein